MKRILREPLFHFLIAGAALFGAYAWLNPASPADSGEASRIVRFTAREVDWLKQTWVRQWSREPSEAELRGLASEYLREELLCREARELGLDENDTVVRRRLAQKMAFLVEDIGRAVEPTEEELRRFHDADPARFHEPDSVSFRHAYFNPDLRGANTDADARRALAELSKLPSMTGDADVGDRFLLQHNFTREREAQLASLFGRQFSRAVFALEPGRWHGPIESGYGTHLVRVAEFHRPPSAGFDAVREKVLQEWHREHRKATDERYFAALLGKYEIVADEGVAPLLGGFTAAEARR